MDKRVFESLTDDEFFVIYWDCQGFRYGDIEEKFGYSVSWIQKRATSAHKKFGINKLVPTERNKILENEVCPALHEWIENHPEKVKRLTEPDYPPEDPEMETTLTPPTPPQVITVVSKQPPKYGRLVILAVFICLLVLVVGSVVGYVAYQIGKRSLVPLPAITAVTQVISVLPPTSLPSPISSPTVTLMPTETPTETPLPTETPKPYYNQGEAVNLKTGVVAYIDTSFNAPNGTCAQFANDFGVAIHVVNQSPDQFLLRFNSNTFHATDDVGTEYQLVGSGMPNYVQIPGIDVSFPMDGNYQRYICVLFKGQIPLKATYLLITADWLSGVGPVTFRKDI